MVSTIQRDNYTIYVNPYVVVRSGQFTKHFYIESQKIVSKLGESGNGNANGGNGNGNGGNGNGNGNGNNQEAFQYYYHPDHLGSSSYITDVNGEVSQHVEYFPFGETFLEEHSNSDRTPYLFNGKELDEETGLYYYGARYYDPRTSIWESVDPLGEKFPNRSPYIYSFNNPVKYVDPNGELPILPLLIKAGANGAADMMAQATMNYLFDPNATTVGQAFDNINWWQVTRSTAEGLIPWRTPGGKLGRAAMTAIGDVLANAMDAGSSYTQEQAIQDFAVGFVGDLAGGGIGELVSKYGAKNVAKGLKKIGLGANKIKKFTGIDLLTKSHRNAISGLEDQIKSHKQKLKDYILNPDAFDNKGFLKDASPELREKIINSRIKSLEGQIDNFQKQIDDIKSFKKDVITKE